MRIVFAALAASLLSGAALANGPTPYSILDGGGISRNFNATTDGSGNYSPNVGGFDTGTSPTVTATPANSSHAAGVSVGGLFTVPMARVNGGSGIITNINWISSGGALTSFVVRLWDKNPGATTCTDNSAYVPSVTDNVHLLTQPLTIQPQYPADASSGATYYGQSGMGLNFKNQDGSPGTSVYVCVTTVSTETADDNHAVYLTLTGTQD